MGIRRAQDDPFEELPKDIIETSLRLLAGSLPAQRSIEETEFPAIDVFETPHDVVIEAELPGVEPADVGVTAAAGLIVIEGTKLEEPGPGRVNYLCMERSFGVFRRVVRPGAAVDLSRTTAVCRDGILRVRVPKVEEKRGQVRVIPVTAAPSGERSEP